MIKHTVGIVILTALAAVGVASASAEPGPHGFLDAKVQVRDAGDGLAGTVLQLRTGLDEPQWVAWEVPAADPRRSACCSDGGFSARVARTCNLESHNEFSGSRDDALHPGGDLRVLLRLSAGAIDKVRVYSRNCPLNAAGRRVTVLENVESTDSVRFLEDVVKDDRVRRDSDETVMAIAWHAGPAADSALERFAQRDSPRRLRERAAFWLGESRGESGLALLRRMLRQERDNDVLEQVVFGISLSTGAGAGELLINTARNDERPEIRKHALFWLAQRAGERAVDTLGRAVVDDPDAEVREHAVFALSQLPDGRGVPMLIELARNNRHPEVRRRAIFWLGQSGDRRALDLFEEILADWN